MLVGVRVRITVHNVPGDCRSISGFDERKQKLAEFGVEGRARGGGKEAAIVSKKVYGRAVLVEDEPGVGEVRAQGRLRE